MIENVSVPAKYVFLDVVQFTRNRDIEDQAYIVEQLNRCVEFGLEQSKIPESRRILLPTGDGMCIVLVALPPSGESPQEEFVEPFDLHLRLARYILTLLAVHNERVQKENPRAFQIRIGINQANTDILYTDINGRWNMAGAGINRAQRVMSMADGNQMLVSRSVHDDLQPRRDYAHAFAGPYHAEVKHGEILELYQYRKEGATGLNNDPPSALEGQETSA